MNLALDRFSKDKEKTRRDLGALYATDGDSAEVRPLPQAGPMGPPPAPFAPPPPSDFALEAHPAPAAHSSGGFDYAIPPPYGYGETHGMGGEPSSKMPEHNAAAAAALGGDRATLSAPPPLSKAIRTPTVADLPPLPDLSRRPPVAPSITAARVAPVATGRAAMPAPLPPPPSTLDDDILGQTTPAPPSDVPEVATRSTSLNLSATLEPVGTDLASIVAQQATPEGEHAYFRQIYEEFIELKQKCGEPTDSLTFEKFVVKLTQNRDALIAKYQCRAVKFQVYVKDGKAALKATPVKG